MKAETSDKNDNGALSGEEGAVVFEPGELFHGYIIEKQIGRAHV